MKKPFILTFIGLVLLSAIFITSSVALTKIIPAGEINEYEFHTPFLGWSMPWAVHLVDTKLAMDDPENNRKIYTFRQGIIYKNGVKMEVFSLTGGPSGPAVYSRYFNPCKTDLYDLTGKYFPIDLVFDNGEKIRINKIYDGRMKRD